MNVCIIRCSCRHDLPFQNTDRRKIFTFQRHPTGELKHFRPSTQFSVWETGHDHEIMAATDHYYFFNSGWGWRSRNRVKDVIIFADYYFSYFNFYLFTSSPIKGNVICRYQDIFRVLKKQKNILVIICDIIMKLMKLGNNSSSILETVLDICRNILPLDLNIHMTFWN